MCPGSRSYTSRRLERVREPAIEHQAHIVVVLDDPSTFVVLDGDDRVEVLTQAAADNLERDALTGFHIDRVAVEVGFAGISQNGDGPVQMLRTFRVSRDFVARSATVARSSIKKNLALLRPLLVAKPKSVNAQRGVGG